MNLGFYEQELARTAPLRAGAGWSALEDKRAVALQRFLALGLPDRKDEAWRYTPLARFVGKERPVAPRGRSVDGLPEPLCSRRLVFVDGFYRPDLSSVGDFPKGVAWGSLGELGKQEQWGIPGALWGEDGGRALTALNGALFVDGLWIEVAPDADAGALEVLWVGGAALAQGRVAVRLGRGAHLELVESFLSEGGGWTNGLSVFQLEANSRFTRVKHQGQDPASLHTWAAEALLGQGAHFASTCLQTGSHLGREELAVRLQGRDARCELKGLYVGDGERQLDQMVLMDHAAEHCQSEQLFKGLLAGKARGVFDGKVLVRRGADKTDAAQTSRALLLSRDAESQAKPQLEIYADDVKCSHGATTGQLQSNALFYLRARGVPEAEARALLALGFVREVLGELPYGPLVQRVEAATRAALGGGASRG